MQTKAASPLNCPFRERAASSVQRSPRPRQMLRKCFPLSPGEHAPPQPKQNTSQHPDDAGLLFCHGKNSPAALIWRSPVLRSGIRHGQIFFDKNPHAFACRTALPIRKYGINMAESFAHHKFCRNDLVLRGSLFGYTPSAVPSVDSCTAAVPAWPGSRYATRTAGLPSDAGIPPAPWR